ncbi:ATP-dependent DNA helicase [Trichonephila clavipes]|nr:ATP-dependent DNA helicase [Trichonephila clavipes]
MYVKVESERLRFIALNQTKLRAENYIHLQDAIRNNADLDPNSLGQMVILQSSFVNSTIYLHEYTQDAFTYVRNYGMPDLFITMTCNPAWPEITTELIPGQNSTYRHDLTARVFKVKVQKLVALLTKGKIFGYEVLHVLNRVAKKRFDSRALTVVVDGRIYTVHVSNFECYCLRMLLNVIQGPTNFLDLKTVDGQEFETFRQVCEKLGLLEDDNHWDATMEEAVLCRSPSQVRELFAILICTCGLSNPLQLWDKYKVALSEVTFHRFEKMDQVNNDLCLNEALIHIDDKIIRIFGKKLSDFGMPTPTRRGELSTDLIKELSYNIALLDTQVSETEPRLLPEHKDIYNKILQRVELGEGGLFFLEAPGSTGKTFLLNLLLAKIRKDRNVALAVASSRIAATLLSGGWTAHSVFKLPLNLASEETPTCNISKNSARGALLQQCKLIVLEECTMSHKRAIEALYRCLQDIQNNRKLMGGVVMFLAGYFRQILSVTERGTAADEINACLKASYLWTKVENLYLTTNMRVQLFSDVESGIYAQKLLEMGEGHLDTDQEASETSVYNFIDTVMSSDDTTSYPVEFLNSLDLSGVPSHKLELKVGVPFFCESTTWTRQDYATVLGCESPN